MPVIDEKEPLEAVHKETGRVVPLTFKEWNVGTHNGKRWFSTVECPDRYTSNYDWYDDGGDLCHHNKWVIRNAQAAPALPADWAIQAALDRVAHPVWTLACVKSHPTGYPSLIELARMIEKHEEAPDPLAEHRELVATMWDISGWPNSAEEMRRGAYDDTVSEVMEYLRANVDKITRSA